MMFAFTVAAWGYLGAFTALGTPGNQIEGVPVGMVFFMTTILLLAAIGDARMIWAGGIQGSRRLARHLWRMCFELFIASGSFLLGQMKFIPEPIRILPLLFVVAPSPLVILLYRMWQVRLRQNLRGVTEQARRLPMCPPRHDWKYETAARITSILPAGAAPAPRGAKLVVGRGGSKCYEILSRVGVS